MPTSASLPRALRQIPEFHSWSAPELANLAKQMTCKELKPGEVLWREGNRLDFLAVVQSGEIVLEYRSNGRRKWSVQLMPGDYVMPHPANGSHYRSSLKAVAASHGKLFVLRIGQLEALRSGRPAAAIRSSPPHRRAMTLSWHALWFAAVALLAFVISWPDASRLLAGILYLRSGQDGMPLQNLQGSLQLLDYARALAPGAVFAYNREGYLWYQHSRPLLAEAAFSSAVMVDQSYGPSLNNLAVIYFSKGELERAAILQQQALENDRNQAVILYNLGIMMAQQGYDEEAIRAFREASIIDPRSVLPYIQLGYLSIRTQDFGMAEESARAALRLDPSQPMAHTILAIALMHQDRNPEALAAIATALQIAPDDRVAGFYQGLILSRLGDHPAALAIFEELLNSTGDPLQASRIQAEIDAIDFYLENHPGSQE
jgi:tetratricopeptide (TPR) repeat protein